MKKSFSLTCCTFASAVALLVPSTAQACACAFNIYDIGTSSLLPTEPGGIVYFNFGYQDQNRNWSGSSRAPADQNEDRELRTHFYTLGGQYFINKKWGVQLDVPMADRYFATQEDGEELTGRSWTALGDIRLKGIYTGFSEDMSTGLTFGIKLPTGDFKHAPAEVDRDSQVGSGSTDLLLGAFHRQAFTSHSDFHWFAQGEVDVPVFTQDHYRPGVELNAATGTYYTGWSVGSLKINPVAQVIGTLKTHDTGSESASPVASGYARILLSAGVEFDFKPFSIYADVEIPVFDHVRGNQIVSPALFKLLLSYHF